MRLHEGQLLQEARRRGSQPDFPAIRRAQEVAKENGKSTKFNGTIPKNLQLTLHDGDEEADLERNPEYEGHWYMTVSSKTKPGIVARDLEPITDSTEVYSQYLRSEYAMQWRERAMFLTDEFDNTAVVARLREKMISLGWYED